MLVWKIFVLIFILSNCEAKCSKKGWKKIEKTIKDSIDKYIEDMKGDTYSYLHIKPPLCLFMKQNG